MPLNNVAMFEKRYVQAGHRTLRTLKLSYLCVMVQERRRCAAMRFVLQSADTRANLARTKHNFRKHVQGRFDADFEIPHRSRKWNAAQLGNCAHTSAALPGKLKGAWINGTSSRHAKKHLKGEKGMFTLLGQENKDQDAKSESVNAWLDSTPARHGPLEGCDVVQLQVAFQNQSGVELTGDDQIESLPNAAGVEIQVGADALTESNAVGSETGQTASPANRPEEQFECHVSCDDLARQCLGK